MSQAYLILNAKGLIRDRAHAATPGRWVPATTGVEHGDHWHVLGQQARSVVAHIPSNDGDNEAQRPRDAQHIASWHPIAAWAVADLLDAVLARHEPITDPDGETVCAHCVHVGSPTLLWPCPDVEPALAFARAYLGRDR